MAARLTVFGTIAKDSADERVERSLAVLYPAEDEQPVAAASLSDDLLADVSIQELKRLGIPYKLFHHEPVRLQSV